MLLCLLKTLKEEEEGECAERNISNSYSVFVCFYSLKSVFSVNNQTAVKEISCGKRKDETVILKPKKWWHAIMVSDSSFTIK